MPAIRKDYLSCKSAEEDGNILNLTFHKHSCDWISKILEDSVYEEAMENTYPDW